MFSLYIKIHLLYIREEKYGKLWNVIIYRAIT